MLVAHDSLRAQGDFGPVGGGGKPFDRIDEAAKRYLARLLGEFYDDAPLARLVRKLLEEAGFADSRFARDKHERPVRRGKGAVDLLLPADKGHVLFFERALARFLNVRGE